MFAIAFAESSICKSYGPSSSKHRQLNGVLSKGFVKSSASHRIKSADIFVKKKKRTIFGENDSVL